MSGSIVITETAVVSPAGNSEEELLNTFRSKNPPLCKRLFVGKRRFDYCMPQVDFSGDPQIFFAEYLFTEIFSKNPELSKLAGLEDTGLLFSTGKGGIYFLDKDPVNHFRSLFPSYISSHIMRKYFFSGPAKVSVTACATGTHTLCEAVSLVKDGAVKRCFAGAVDFSATPLMLAGYDKMGVYSKNSELKPFSAARNGFLIGAGGGLVLIENEESAIKRGADIKCEISGFILGQDISGIFRQSKKGSTLRDLLVKIRKKINAKIDYLNLHGTGTKYGDIYESAQIKQYKSVFNEDTLFSSTKCYTGHMLGAAGVVEGIIALSSIKFSFAPAMLSDDIDGNLFFEGLLFGSGAEREIKNAVSLSIGFGGQIGIIGFRKYEK